MSPPETVPVASVSPQFRVEDESQENVAIGRGEKNTYPESLTTVIE
jgi:hypothetical protein